MTGTGTKANPRQPPRKFDAQAAMTGHVQALTELLARMRREGSSKEAIERIAARLDEAKEAAR